MEKTFPKYSREKFMEACKNNDINFIQNAIENKLIKRVSLDFALESMKIAGSNGHINIIHYLFEDNSSNKFFSKHANSIFLYACLENRLNVVKYLIENHLSKIDKKDNNQRDNYSNINVGAYYATKMGNVKILDYLFNSNLPHFLPESLKDGVLFSYSCTSPGLNCIKYLFSKPELKKHIDLHFGGDMPFKRMFESLDLEAMKYFIFDLQIEKTQEITEFLDKLDGFSNIQAKKVKDFFAIREFKEGLTEELGTNEKIKSNKSLKI